MNNDPSIFQAAVNTQINALINQIGDLKKQLQTCNFKIDDLVRKHQTLAEQVEALHTSPEQSDIE